jgi:AcrR family transcriptional regulator
MVATSAQTLSKPAAKPGEEDSAKRKQILDGARRVFLDLGFDGASMGEIARVAGVSKGTLYVYFADKHHLFEAIVEQENLDYGRETFNFSPERDPETTLFDFGCAYMTVICRPHGGSAVRTVMAIAERMPDLGRRYYAQVIEKTVSEFATYLKARIGAGDLAIDDPELAATQFMQTCQASLFLPFILQVTPPPSREQIEKSVRSATRMFLAAYGKRGG